jgi:hypothetical protein
VVGQFPLAALGGALNGRFRKSANDEALETEFVAVGELAGEVTAGPIARPAPHPTVRRAKSVTNPATARGLPSLIAGFTTPHNARRTSIVTGPSKDQRRIQSSSGMERHDSRSSSVPRRPVAVIVASVAVMGFASLIYLWPTINWPRPAVVHQVPRPTPTFPSYDVVVESTISAYVLLRPGGSGPSTDRLYRTKNAGATWLSAALPALPPGDTSFLRRLPGGNLFLQSFGFAKGVQHFYLGDGSTWTEVTVPGQTTGSLQMIDSRVGFYIVTATAGSVSTPVPTLLIYRTLDGGHNWEQRLDLDAGHPSAGGLHLGDNNSFITFSDRAHGWLVIIPPSWGIVCGVTNPTDSVQQLMSSQDGGASWAPVSLPNLPQSSTQLNTPAFPGGGASGYLTVTASIFVRDCPPAGINMMFSSLDEGATWSGPHTLPGPFFDSPDGIEWWATDGRQLFRSHNQGASWQTTVPTLPSPSIMLQDLFVVNANAAWSLWSGPIDQPYPQKESLLRTTDAGAHWSEVKLPTA